MRFSNPSSIHDIFESCAILIESSVNVQLLNRIDTILGDLSHECECIAYAIRFDDAMYDLYHLDVWVHGEDENGILNYDVNEQFRVGEVFLPDIIGGIHNQESYVDTRLDELIDDENLAAHAGIAWESIGGDPDTIEIRDGTGRPWVTLMQRNLAPDVEAVVAHIGSLVKQGQTNKEYDEFKTILDDLKTLVMDAYSSDESGHELLRLRTWISRLSRAAAYRSLAVNGNMSPPSTKQEIEQWSRWMTAALSPEENESVVSEWIDTFEKTIANVGFTRYYGGGDWHTQTNAAFNQIETAILGIVRQNNHQ